jgi:hypothetical protein
MAHRFEIMTCSGHQPTQVASPCGPLPCPHGRVQIPSPLLPPQSRSGTPPFPTRPTQTPGNRPKWSPVGWCTASSGRVGFGYGEERHTEPSELWGFGACDLSHLPPPTPSVHLWVLPHDCPTCWLPPVVAGSRREGSRCPPALRGTAGREMAHGLGVGAEGTDSCGSLVKHTAPRVDD